MRRQQRKVTALQVTAGKDPGGVPGDGCEAPIAPSTRQETGRATHPPATLTHVEFIEIAGYRVIRQLGAGGMGQVFLVEHPRLPRQDALKLLDAGVSRNDDFKVRFQREADLLAKLS